MHRARGTAQAYIKAVGIGLGLELSTMEFS
jgi:hypothetical protein